MGKALSDMTLEELWKLFPIVLTEHNEIWNKWYESEQIRLYSFLPAQLETTSFRTFSATVRSGDYISVDMGDDGKWDHCGFVTDWNNTEKTYNYTFPNSSSTITMKYHDFKIAQHTSDTHDWVSSSRINWEAAGPEAASRGRYALVKRSNFVNGQN